MGHIRQQPVQTIAMRATAVQRIEHQPVLVTQAQNPTPMTDRRSAALVAVVFTFPIS
jgi:hypothetical protein